MTVAEETVTHEGVTLALRPDASGVVVRVHLGGALSVFGRTLVIQPDQARDLADSLYRTASRAERAAGAR